jgi:hypothetical protein
MDILAIRKDDNQMELRHYEVHASVNAVSYITSVPKAIQKATGRARDSAKRRSLEEIDLGVKEWIEQKFTMPKKAAMRERLWPGNWSFHFVVNDVKHQEELEAFRWTSVEIIELRIILDQLRARTQDSYTAASKDPIDLMLLTTNRKP